MAKMMRSWHTKRTHNREDDNRKGNAYTDTYASVCVLVRNYYLFNWGCAVSTTDTQRYRVGPGPGLGVAQGQQE